MENPFKTNSKHADYDIALQSILYRENAHKLKDRFNLEQFINLEKRDKVRLFSELDLTMEFILEFSDSILAFLPIVRSFIINSDIDEMNIDKDMVCYLGICALAISFDRPKESYRQLFTELRMRNIYSLLEGMVMFTRKMVYIFEYITSKLSSNVDYNVIGMFMNKLLFIPFSLCLAHLLRNNEVKLENINDAINEDLVNIDSVSIGKDSITLSELIKTLISNIKEFQMTDYKKYLSKSILKMSHGITDYILSIKPNSIFPK